MKIRILAVFLLALSLGAPSMTWAQGSGSLTVSISDNYGVLPGAVVRLFGKDGQAPQRAVADATGNARFSSLAAGEYTLRASLTGFADTVKAVTVGATEEKVELVMSLTRFSTTVTVTTANRREELLMDTAEPTTVIDQVQILDTGARNAKDLLSEQQGSGVQVNVGGGQGYVSLNGVSNKGRPGHDRRPPVSRPRRERQLQPRRPPHLRSRAGRSGQGRRLRPLWLRRHGRRHQLHHRPGQASRFQEPVQLLRRHLQRLPGRRQSHLPREQGRLRPHRRLPDVRRLRPEPRRVRASCRRPEDLHAPAA